MPWRATDPLWTSLDDGVPRNGEPPSARVWRDAATRVNHVLARNHRVLFCQHAALGFLPTADTNPLYVFRYNDDFGHGRRLDYRVIAARIAAPITGDPRMEIDTGEAIRTVEEDAAVAESSDTRQQEITRTYGPITNAYANKDARVFSGYRPVALAVIQRPRNRLLVATADAALGNPARFIAGEKIEDAPLADLDSAFDYSWLRQRKIVAAWASYGLGNVKAKTVESTTYTNLIDFAAHAWTTTSAGLICPVENEGRGAAVTVEAQCAVYAEGTAAGQTVRFESGAASGNVVDITVDAVKQWWPAGSLLNLRTTGPIAPGVEKVDVAARVSAAPENVRIWAWMIAIDPA